MARLGEHALEGASTVELMQEAVSTAAGDPRVEIAAVLELLPDEDCAGRCEPAIGWPDSAFGSLRYPAGDGSAGRATRCSRRAPVVVEDWNAETRFEQPDAERAGGRAAALSVPIEGRSREPVRRARGPVDGAARASPRATSTSCRPWPTCSPTRSSARRSRTPSATARCTTRSPGCPTACCSSTASSMRWPGSAAQDSQAASCSSTSTTSSWSTTASATTSATSCSPRPPRACSRRCARATPWPGSAATSSGSCSRTSPPSTTRSRSPSGSPRCSPGRSCCRARSTS